MRIVAAPDGAVNRIDRALWMTPIFDLAFGAVSQTTIDAPPRFPAATVLSGIAHKFAVNAGAAPQQFTAAGIAQRVSCP